MRLTVAGIVVLAGVLRLTHANADYWFDEIATVTANVDAPLARMVTQYEAAGNHVLHSVLLRLATAAGGTAPWIARLPAIAFGVAGIWAFWFVARQLWPHVSALIGTLLFAVSFHHIYYSQDARGYTGFLFFALVATGCLLRLLGIGDRPPRRRDRVGYALAIALGLYTMPLMAFVAAGHASVLLVHRRRTALGPLAAGVGLGALLYAPMWPSLLAYYREHPDHTGYPVFSAAFARMLAPIAVALAAGGLLALPLVARFWRRQAVAVLVLLAPIAFNVIVPVLRGQGVYPRSFVYGLVVAYLLQIELVDWLRAVRPALGWLWAAAVAAASLTQLGPYYQLPKQGFRQALAYVEERRAPGETRLGVTLAGKAARFYDPAIVLIENAAQIQAWTRQAREPAWIISTFPAEIRSSDPDLHRWLESMPPVASFPGVIGDGTVELRYWTPPAAR